MIIHHAKRENEHLTLLLGIFMQYIHGLISLDSMEMNSGEETTDSDDNCPTVAVEVTTECVCRCEENSGNSTRRSY